MALSNRKYQAILKNVAHQVAKHFGERVICDRCGCTAANFSEKCSADLDDACPGFKAIDQVRSAELRKAGAV